MYLIAAFAKIALPHILTNNQFLSKLTKPSSQPLHIVVSGQVVFADMRFEDSGLDGYFSRFHEFNGDSEVDACRPHIGVRS